MNKQDILIRLLKEGHISEYEFKVLYESTIKEEQKHPHTTLKPQYKEPDILLLYNPTQMPIKKHIMSSGEELYTLS